MTVTTASPALTSVTVGTPGTAGGTVVAVGSDAEVGGDVAVGSDAEVGGDVTGVEGGPLASVGAGAAGATGGAETGLTVDGPLGAAVGVGVRPRPGTNVGEPDRIARPGDTWLGAGGVYLVISVTAPLGLTTRA